MTATQALTRLETVLTDIGEAGVAVSGGVDSMTLAFVAHRLFPDHARMLHAISPAVPQDATERVRRYASQHGWALEILNAGEFEDPAYMANPHDRCFHCKTNLYNSIAARVQGQIVSGANVDDLGDYRPGLRAAADHAVRHPFVEAGMTKADVRAVAAHLELDDLAELPASPCLSSRVQTGIAIDPSVLGAIYRVEKWLRAEIDAETVRCRIRSDAVVIELDDQALGALSADRRIALGEQVGDLVRSSGLAQVVTFEPYRMGSAFVRPQA
jgi:uncharacterized protein